MILGDQINTLKFAEYTNIRYPVGRCMLKIQKALYINIVPVPLSLTLNN